MANQARDLPPKHFVYQVDDAPTTPTDITAVLTWVTKIRIANTTAGALTFTLDDKTGSPIAKYTAVSIAANSVSLESMPDTPEKFVGGITLDTSGAGLSVTIEGWQTL